MLNALFGICRVSRIRSTGQIEYRLNIQQIAFEVCLDIFYDYNSMDIFFSSPKYTDPILEGNLSGLFSFRFFGQIFNTCYIL